MCALYLKTYNNLFSAAFEQNLNENSWEPKTGVFEPVGECERHLKCQECMPRARHYCKWIMDIISCNPNKSLRQIA